MSLFCDVLLCSVQVTGWRGMNIIGKLWLSKTKPGLKWDCVSGRILFHPLGSIFCGFDLGITVEVYSDPSTSKPGSISLAVDEFPAYV